MRKRIASLLLSIALLASAGVAQANENDVQIDWMVSAHDWTTVAPLGQGRNVRFNYRMLPSTIYAIDEDVVAEDGTKLLPAGAQLYAMTGPSLAACSQLASKPPYAGAAKRVCLRDDDGDGVFDTYWLRFPIQQLLGKGDWLFLNGDIPIQRARVMQTHSPLRILPSDAAEKPGELSLSFSLHGDGSVSGGIWVKDGQTFYGSCNPMKAEVDHTTKQWCLIRELIAQGVNFDSKDKAERHLEIIRPNRDVKVRFNLKRGMLMGFSVESIYLK